MFTWNCRGRLVTIEKPLVMGIINATPDSFYSGSRHRMVDEMLMTAEKMLTEGADILDIGGQSTRPGSPVVSEAGELDRVEDGIRAIHGRFPEAIISIDTYYGSVARRAVDAGASIVNDISAGTMDPEMIGIVSGLGVPYVLMHMKGNPQTMQSSAEYDDVTREVLDFFAERVSVLRDAGINDIIIDPGFGFGKTAAHNFELLNNLPVFAMLECPLLVGISRKSTIYKTLGITAEEALNGTTVLNTIGLMKGANILRVHDVKEAKEVVRLVDACMNRDRRPL